MNLNSLKMADNKIINSEFLEIKGNLVKCNRTIIQMSNISMLTTTDFAKVPFPIWTIFIGLLGLYCMIQGEMSAFLLGILLVAVPVLAIWFWKEKMNRVEQTKKLNFVLNCGTTYTIIFKDLEFLNKVVSVFTNILADSDKNQNIYFDIKNGDMKIIEGNYTENDIHHNQFMDNSSANKLG